MSTGQGDTPIHPTGGQPTDEPAEPATDIDAPPAWRHVRDESPPPPPPPLPPSHWDLGGDDEPAGAIGDVDLDSILGPETDGGNGGGNEPPPPPFDFEIEDDTTAPAWFAPAMDQALGPIHERLDNHGQLIAGLRTDVDSHGQRMADFERDAAEAIANAAVNSGIIEGVVTTVAANVIDERIAPLITANTEAINANTAQVAEIGDRVTGLTARVDQVEEAVRPENLRTTVTEIIDTRMDDVLMVGFNWFVFAIIMVAGFFVDIIFFARAGEYTSPVDPGLASDLTHHMHWQNFFAVMLVVAAIATFAGALAGSRRRTGGEERERRVWVFRRNRQEPEPAATPEPAVTPAAATGAPTEPTPAVATHA